MHPAALIALGFCLLYTVYAVLLFRNEEGVRRGLTAFPRSRMPGLVLSAVGLAWAVWHVWQIPFEVFTWIPKVALFGAPILYWLIITEMKDLLSVRSLGAVMMLVGVAVLDAIRWHDSSARLVLTTVMYIMGVKGMFFTASPYWFRYGVEWMWAKPGRVKMVKVMAVVMAVIMAVLVPVLRTSA